MYSCGHYLFKERRCIEIFSIYLFPSVNSMPSGWGLIGMSFVEGLTSPVTNILSMFTRRTVAKGPKSSSWNRDEFFDYEPKSGNESPQEWTNRKIYSINAPEIKAQVIQLLSLCWIHYSQCHKLKFFYNTKVCLHD